MRRLNPITIALIAGAALVLLVAALLFFRRGDSDQDKLTGESSTVASASTDPQKRCASSRTYDLIKRDLFRRAAEVRGSDQAAFDSLAPYASIRMERPVVEREEEDRGAVFCSGALFLDLPPGVAVVGGRRTLSANVDYSLESSADRSGDVLTLSNADAIITPLATLIRTSAPAPAPGSEMPADSTAVPGDTGFGQDSPPAQQPAPAPPPVTQPAPAPQPEPTRPATTSARPSFNCANARTRGERAVCSSGELANLDRQMAAQFNRAMASASPGERQMLERTRGSFLRFRDRCGSDACVAETYRGRMREISDITSGRWSPER